MGSPPVSQLSASPAAAWGRARTRPSGPKTGRTPSQGQWDLGHRHRAQAICEDTCEDIHRKAEKRSEGDSFIQKESVGDLTAVMESALFTRPFSLSEMFFQTQSLFLYVLWVSA